MSSVDTVPSRAPYLNGEVLPTGLIWPSQLFPHRLIEVIMISTISSCFGYRYFVLYSNGVIRYYAAVSPDGEKVSEKVLYSPNIAQPRPALKCTRRQHIWPHARRLVVVSFVKNEMSPNGLCGW